MKPFEDMVYHPTTEKVVDILINKTQFNNPLFFRVVLGYYFSTIASMMRVSIDTLDRGVIPINMYALTLSPTGSGKGFSTNIIENEIVAAFRNRYLEATFPIASEINLPLLAIQRANRKGVDPDEEEEAVRREFDSLGTLLYSFDSATDAAIKQQRHKLLMANAGALNLEIDEIGNNLVKNADGLSSYLELFDVGAIKTKLIKSSAENRRLEEIRGNTPANLLMFGTPSKLLDGASNEEELYSMLETGYARRCFFGYGRRSSATAKSALTAEQILDRMTDQTDSVFLQQLSDDIEDRADPTLLNSKLTISRDTTLAMLEYKIHCEKLAEQYLDHEEIKKSEMAHRFFKTLKLAGAYAFIDGSPEVTLDHLEYAIKLAEESGQAFNQILTRERSYVKLAKYIATAGRALTQADLVEDCPFYKGSASQKAEMINLAIAWGYQNNIILKRSYEDGVEFFSGESLEITDLEALRLSYSNDIVQGYRNASKVPFNRLHELMCAPGLHWVSHQLKGGDARPDPMGYRNEENALPGFNMIVLDVDDGVTMDMVRTTFKDYTYFMYTTKRHTDAEHRFRVVIPINYVLKLDAREYKEFMAGIFEWLPFGVDDGTNQRARKWLSHDGLREYNEGMLFDALPFIPKTRKYEERKALVKTQHEMDNLERWVLNNSGDGNRNNMLLRYAMILVDIGFDFGSITSKVLELNNKMPDKLEEEEIMRTIIVTVGKAITK